MANEQNLQPRPPFTPEEAQEFGKKGAKASAKAKNEKKLLANAMLKKLNAKTLNEIADGAIARAKKTDTGLIVLRDTIGEKPVEVVDFGEVPRIIDDIQR